MGLERVIPHVADQENNSKSQINLCGIFKCYQSRSLCLLRYRKNIPQNVGGQDVSESNHTERKHIGY
jgi:hypothetical protein